MNSLLSIDLGSRNLHIAEGIFQKNVLTINRMETFPMPVDCIKGDTILNTEEVATTLSSAIKTFGAKSKEICLTINAIGALIRDVDLPVAKPRELDAMIKNEMMQHYSVTDNHEIQYKVIEKIHSKDGSPMARYRAIALELPLIESYYQLVRKQKKKPEVMDINVNAIDKLLGTITLVNKKPLNIAGTMFIDFGHHSTTLYIYAQGKPLFYRHLSMGSKEIEKIISEETLSPTENIRELKESGFNLFGQEEQAKTYFKYLRPYFYSFNEEIRNIIDFYSERNNGIAVEQIYLFGGGSKLSGLCGYWESNLNIPVEMIQEISGVNLPQNQGDLGLYLNSLGAIIRY